MLASDVISSSGADDEPSKMAPHSSSMPIAPHAFLRNSVAGAGMNLIDSNAPSASSQARNGVR
jgi:hypothetical protein